MNRRTFLGLSVPLGWYMWMGWRFNWGPPAPSIDLVQVDANYIDAQYRKYGGVVSWRGNLLFNYQNARVSTDGRDGLVRHPLDEQYKLPSSLDELNKMLRWGRAQDTRNWAAERYDCDDRAIQLKARLSYQFDYNLGIVLEYNVAHIFNVAMLSNGDVFIVEPEDVPPSVHPIEEQFYVLLTGSLWH